MKAVITLIFLSAATAASAAVIRNPDQWFAARDSNNDRKISLGEFIDHQTMISERGGKNWTVSSMKYRFQTLDVNKDNVISLQELLPRAKPETSKYEQKNTASPPMKVSSPKSLKELHPFVAKNGQTSEARIIAFDPIRNIVTLKNNVCSPKVPLNQLSVEDQLYIREWQLLKEFYSESKLKVSAKRKQFNVERKRHVENYYGSENAKTTVEQIGYEITLENRMASTLKNVSIEYCIFYEQERRQGDKQVTDEGVKRGVLHISKLAPRSSKVLKTDPVTLRKHELSSNWHYYSGGENTQRGKVVGIWFRVHLPLSDGHKLTRQHSLPDSLQKNRAWSSYDRAVGMNK